MAFERDGKHSTDSEQLSTDSTVKARVGKEPLGDSTEARNGYVVDIDSPQLRDPPGYRIAKTKSAGPLPITLKFEDVEYSTAVNLQGSWFEWKSCRKRTSSENGSDMAILHGISGVVKPGELLAVLGPSGSGKSTLLNALGGRIQEGRLTGKVLYNDSTFVKGMKRRTGFVTQDDVLYPHLTVKETLVYAAYLRLPRKFSKREKVQRAEAVIAELGLEKCKDTRIGDSFLRGVSGGERKRVSIGHEMLIDPSLLLLDEPTSGLDSTISLRIIHLLKRLASRGRTIVTTIHQPSSTIFHTFNTVLLLSEGHVLYYGQGSDAMSYFESVGYRPASVATNPADFLLDLANGITDSSKDSDQEEMTDVVEGSMGDESKNPVSNVHGRDDILTALRGAYRKTLLTKTRKTISQSPVLTDDEFKASQQRRKWPTTWLDQFLILISRGIKERSHNAFAGLTISQVAAISLLCGFLWWNSSADKIQNQVGLLFFQTTFWGFLPLLNATFTFPQERAMLMKERSSRMYRLSAYFLSRTIADLPLELTLPFLSFTLVYWMGGLKRTALAYLASVSIILLNVLVAQGVGLFLGAAIMDLKQASTLSSIFMLSSQLTGGYFVLDTPAWIAWIKYISFPYYAYKLQLMVQYSPNQTYACSAGRCFVTDNPTIENIGFNGLAFCVMALCAMLVGYRVLTYLTLNNTLK